MTSFSVQPAVGAATFFGVGAIGLASKVDGTTAAIIAGVITTALMQIMTYLREGRKHKWDEEERAFDRQQRIDVAEGVKANQVKVAEELKSAQIVIAKHLAAEHARTAQAGRDVTLGGIQEIVTKIQENTAVNEAAIVAGEKAYTEANHLSQKIQQQGLTLREPSRQTDRIQAVVEDTNKIVHDLTEKP